MQNHLTIMGELETGWSVSGEGALVNTWSQKYRVFAESPATTRDEILFDTPGLPKPLQVLVPGTAIVATAGDATKFKTLVKHPVTGIDTRRWDVDITGATLGFDVGGVGGDGGAGPDVQIDPLLLPPVISGGGDLEIQHSAYDADGELILNGVGDPIAIDQYRVFPTRTIERWETAPFNDTVQLTYANTTNSTAFYGAPPGSVLMLPIKHREQRIGDTDYVRVTYSVKLRIGTDPNESDTWTNQAVENLGDKYLDGIDDEHTRDAMGNPGPFRLDVDGRLATNAEDSIFIVPVIRKVDWSPLNL